MPNSAAETKKSQRARLVDVQISVFTAKNAKGAKVYAIEVASRCRRGASGRRLFGRQLGQIKNWPVDAGPGMAAVWQGHHTG